jgi:hypothetical protein
MTTVDDDAHSRLLLGDIPAEERDERLVSGALELAKSRARSSLLANPRFLMGLASLLMTSGFLAIILGWAGASGSIRTQEQIPYLISGGLLGVALSIVGALTLFTHWLTVLVRENRRHHLELLEAVRELRTPPAQEVSNGTARSKSPQRPLRGAARGK